MPNSASNRFLKPCSNKKHHQSTMAPKKMKQALLPLNFVQAPGLKTQKKHLRLLNKVQNKGGGVKKVMKKIAERTKKREQEERETWEGAEGWRQWLQAKGMKVRYALQLFEVNGPAPQLDSVVPEGFGGSDSESE
jgi:hypothetical protein